ncbi:MarR family winged helix-turn-helix transcriptional regulator [Lacticaseibacillus thailandensis]|nr:MarR family winged helix-turn-helix transcriptional regulator [Lacticaseibacillus thailandensis]
MDQQVVLQYLQEYRHLRDTQFALFDRHARSFGLTTKEEFVLYMLWESPVGQRQADICARLSATKQTISSITKKLWQQGYAEMAEDSHDRRRKLVRLTAKGRAYAQQVIAPAAQAEIDAMAALSPAEMAELTRLTRLFSKQMTRTFDALQSAKKI